MSNVESDKGKKGIETWVFWPPFILLFATAFLSFVNYDAFTTIINSSFAWTTKNFGWLFSFSTFAFLVICAVVALTPAGKIKFGGEDAKPTISNWNWFAMSLTAGIAIGIVFWGAAEPIYHFSSPPASSGMAPFSEESALFAISTVFLHWAFHPYALYVVCAIPMGLAYYNHKQPFAVSSSLYFLMGDKCQGPIGKVVDSLCLYAIAGGVAGSLGGGLLQIGSGLDYIFGIKPSVVVWGIIAVVIVSAYTLSSYTGLDKGIKFLADKNAKIFFAVMLFILVVGPTRFIFNLGVQSLGSYIDNFASISLWTSAVNGDQWPNWWSFFYWAAWMAFAPIVALFLIRIIYGRTIRQFILINLVLPGVFAIVWFSIFGGAAIDMQIRGVYDLWGNITANGVEATVFAFFGQFPLSSIMVPMFLFTIMISFVTLADSMTSVVAAMSTKGLTPEDAEAPAYLKIIWGVVMGTMAWVMVGFAGIDGVKMVSTLAGFPIMFLMIFMAISLVKGLYFPEAKLISKDEIKQAMLSKKADSTENI